MGSWPRNEEALPVNANLTMTALQIRGKTDLSMSKIAVPEAGPGEIVVKTAFVGICGTDLHLYHGVRGYSGSR